MYVGVRGPRCRLADPARPALLLWVCQDVPLLLCMPSIGWLGLERWAKLRSGEGVLVWCRHLMGVPRLTLAGWTDRQVMHSGTCCRGKELENSLHHTAN